MEDEMEMEDEPEIQFVDFHGTQEFIDALDSGDFETATRIIQEVAAAHIAKQVVSGTMPAEALFYEHIVADSLLEDLQREHEHIKRIRRAQLYAKLMLNATLAMLAIAAATLVGLIAKLIINIVSGF